MRFHKITQKEAFLLSTYSSYIVAAIAVYLFAYVYYLKISHGLGNKATYLQLRRFIPCAVLALLPATLAQLPLSSPLFVVPTLIAVLWILTYPTLYWLSNHKASPDFEFHFEAVLGLYLMGWFSSLAILILHAGVLTTAALVLIATLEFILLLIPLAQLAYYYLYGFCIDDRGISMIQDTNYNEVIEFCKSLPRAFVLLSTGLIVALYGLLAAAALSEADFVTQLDLPRLVVLAGIALFLTSYLWKRGHGVFVRTGIGELWLDVKEYNATTKLYTQNMQDRIADLTVTSKGESFAKPSTIIFVIGESESRDYMSAFVDYPHDTTPWLRGKKDDPHYILFPHAYSTIAHTVSALERTLTEFNQYNDKQFYSSCSIVDIARQAGYHTYWYSNQGHLGCADTPVTLVANTSDVAKWTKQNLNTVQYDESLLDYLREVDPTTNNFVVIHLKGNHFNFLNRYPQSFAKFSQPDTYDLVPNYIDSIHYTDHILQQIQEYASEHLNLQAMVYFSDHACVPDKRRSPHFGGFAAVRIPFFTYFSDEYIAKHPEVYSTLQANREKYWTNDLGYELLCGILDIKSNHYDESNSLASSQYKYTRDMLLTDLGKRHISEDTQG